MSHSVKFSRLGFILAAVGSAVGLGNIWKFPYVTGEYGGGAFVLVYLIVAIFIGIFILIAESLIGKIGQNDAVSIFENEAKKGKKYWKYAGFMIIIPLIILSYYSVIIGWIFHYIFLSLGNLPENVDESKEIFLNFLHHKPYLQLLYHTATFVIVLAIILRGIKDGIEKVNKILMPTLAVLLLLLLGYSMSVESFSKALSFMFKPDFHKFSSEAVVVAIGQAFYTLSLGMGIIITFAASLPKKANIVKSSVLVSIIDTTVALIAGIVIFTLLFDKGAESTKGAGLVFISLPSVFYEFGAVGKYLSLLFFTAIAFAGITSAISMLEPTVSYFVNRHHFSRIKASIICSLFFYIVGIFALFSNIDGASKYLTFDGKALFDILDFTTSTVLVPIAGILGVIFVGYFLDEKKIRHELHPQLGRPLTNFWFFMIRYVVPVALTVVIINESGILK